MELEGKTALVTGASRGIGRAIAIALAEKGADVACAARASDAAPLKLPGTVDATARAVRDRGRRGLPLPTDLSRPGEAERMVASTLEAFGRIDILVNNAAITFPGDLELPMRRFDLVMAVNLRAPMEAMQAVLPAMKERRSGTILNISSAAAVVSFPGMLAYGVSKAALERLTLGAAELLAEDAVAVNALRIDVPVASEGFIHNAPGVDTSGWEPCEVAAEAAIWVLEQPPSYTGRIPTILELREAHGVAKSRVGAG